MTTLSTTLAAAAVAFLSAGFAGHAEARITKDYVEGLHQKAAAQSLAKQQKLDAQQDLRLEADAKAEPASPAAASGRDS